MKYTDFYQVAIARAHGLFIQVEHQAVPNFSLTLSGYPLVRAISFTNEDAAPIGDVTLKFDLSTEPGVAPTSILLLAPGKHNQGSTTTLRDGLEQKLDFSPDLAALTEATRGRITVTATWEGAFDQPGGEVLLDIPLEFQAVNEFINFPSVHASLVTFIQPNAREVTPILRAASDLLKKRTQDGALNGYQAGSKRAYQIAGALYETLRGLKITYINPPASFENTGQKVRTTRQVVQQQFGTCIDLALLYAAVLEASGLHPLIFITRSHAFAGFYASEYYGEQAVTTDANSISNLVESNLVIPVELTGINPGSRVNYKDALKKAKQYFTINFAKVRSMTDVIRARLMGIKPMVTAQAGATESDMESDVHHRRPFVARSSLKAITSTPDDEEIVTGQLSREDPAPARFKNWKRELLDLTLRNPLLNLPRSGTRLIELLLPSGLLADLDDALHANKPVTLLPNDAFSDVHRAKGVRSVSELAETESRYLFKNFRQVFISSSTDQARRQLQRLMRDAATLSQETGSNYLYITLGHLVFMKPNGDEGRAPLYLLPVKLRGGKFTPYTIKIDGDEIALPNQCLIQWLRTVRGVEFDALNFPPTDEHGIAINTALQELREQFIAQRLPFRVEETASLAILRFSTFQIWNDLNDNWEQLLKNPVVNHLVHKPGETFVEHVEPVAEFSEDELFLPVAADSSQMRAIYKAANGESFVLEGPPGTGKSQTITNMIAHLISSGKTVLFVAEKQAALEVVKRRLEATGIGPFALELHGKNQTMSSIREQLKNALEAGHPPDDSERSERNWRIEHGKLAALIGQLNQYPERIHAKNSAGESLWSAYQHLQEYQDGFRATVPLEWLNKDPDVEKIISTVVLFGKIAGRELRTDHPWLMAAQALTPQNEQHAFGVAQDLNSVLSAVIEDSALSESLAALPGPHLLSHFAQVIAGVEEDFNAPTHARLNQATWQRKSDAAQQKLAAFFHEHGSALATFTPEAFYSSEPADHLARAERVSGKFFADFRLRRVKKFLLRHTRDQHAPINRHSMVSLLQAITRAQASGAQLHDYFISASILVPASQWRPWQEGATEQVERNLRLLHSFALVNEAAPQLLSGHRLRSTASHELLQRSSQAWQAWLEILQPSSLQITQWAASSPMGWFAAWKRDGAQWQRDLQGRNFMPWQRMARINEQVNVIASAGLEDFARELLSLEIPTADAVAAFGHGLAATSFTERARAADVDYHDSDLLDSLSVSYNQQSEVIRNLLTTRLPQKIARLRPFPPGLLRGEVAELKRQVDRKRGGYSFRELTQRYGQAILSLTPCFLMSPGSVAHFLDEASIKFDVVIFDEASQIRVPQAIGSLGRANSAVIVGDSRQMPPTRVMEVRTSLEDETDTGEVVVGDLESILSEAVESGLPQHWLSWHYRSKDESLITFSNQHYYDSKLITFPSPRVHDERVHLRNVDGVFDRGKTRTNRMEADAIVADITRRLHDPSCREESIGVVCFNIQQRDLILTLLEESEDLSIQNALQRQDGEEIFVKNLENVQGDERDVILFSLAFSVDPDTGVLPLQFGPLILAGGERRLNVAITRARAEIVLFTSFRATDIDLRRTSSVGLRHLRAYMESIETRELTLGTVDSSIQRGRVLTELATELEEHGVEVEPLLGSSRLKVDLAVRRAGTENWQLAVLLDSPRWAMLETVADREGYPKLLSNLVDWPRVHRVWLPAWLRDRKTQVDKVLAALDATDEAEKTPLRRVEDLPLSTDALIIEDPNTDNFATQQLAQLSEELVDPKYEFGAPFIPASIEPCGRQNVLNNIGAHRDRIKQAINTALATESPIALERLIQIVGRNFSYSRLGRKKREELSAFITTEYQITESGGSFVWARDMGPETWQGYRVVSATSERPITEVSHHEIINCGRRILAQAFSVTEEELPREIAHELGYSRLTTPVAERVKMAIGIATKAGLIVLEEGRFHGG